MPAERERNKWPWEADPSKRREGRGFFASIFGPPASSKEAAAPTAEAAATADSRAAAAPVLQDRIPGHRSHALAEQTAAPAAPEASASEAGAKAEAEDEAEAKLEAEFAAADRAAAEKALRAAMPGWFSSADPVLLGQAVAAARQHGVSAELLSRAEEALTKVQASDIYVEFPASTDEGATAAGATPKRRSGGRAESPASSMYAEQGSVHGHQPAGSTRLLGGTGGNRPGGGPGGGGDFLARLEELEERYAAYDGGASEGDEYSARDSDGGQPPHASPGNGVQSPGFVAPSPGYEMPPAGWDAEGGESGDGFGMGLGVLPESDAGLRLQHAAKLLLERAAAEARLAREQPWAAPLGHGPARPQAVADAVNHVLAYAREGVRRGGHGRRRRHLLAAAVRVLLSTAPAASVHALQAEAALPLLLRLVAAPLWPLRAPPSVATAMATEDATAVLAQRMRPPPPPPPPQARVAAAAPTGGRAARRVPPPPRAPPHAHVPPPRADEHQCAHASPMMRRPRGAAAPAVGLPRRPAAGRSGRPELNLKELNLRPLKGLRDPSLLTSVAPWWLADGWHEDGDKSEHEDEGGADGASGQREQQPGWDAVGDAVASGLHEAGRALEEWWDEAALKVSKGVASLGGGGGGEWGTTSAVPLRVVARLRPQRPPLGRRSRRLLCEDGCVRVLGEVRAALPASFQFDAVLEEHATQQEAYEHGAAQLLPRLLAGGRAAMLYAGQAGAGKTHTCFGSRAVLTNLHAAAAEEWGAAPRLTKQLFEALGEAAGAGGPLELRVSWLELCGTRLRDLLGESGRELRLRESAAHGAHVPELSLHVAESHDRVLALLQAGARNRRVAATRNNLLSSRSHTFFCLHLRRRRQHKHDNGPPAATDACLTLVDLAAPPPPTALPAAARKSDAPAEVGEIEASLGALSSVLAGLRASQASGSPALAEPFRAHPLCRLVQPMLLGDCVCAACINVSVAEADMPATLAALRLGALLRGLQTHIKPHSRILRRATTAAAATGGWACDGPAPMQALALSAPAAVAARPRDDLYAPFDEVHGQFFAAAARPHSRSSSPAPGARGRVRASSGQRSPTKHRSRSQPTAWHYAPSVTLAEVPPSAAFVSPPLIEYLPHAPHASRTSPRRRSPPRAASRGFSRRGEGEAAEYEDAWVAVGYTGSGGAHGGGGGAGRLPEAEESYVGEEQRFAELRAETAALQRRLSQERAAAALGAGAGPGGYSSGDEGWDQHKGGLDAALPGGAIPWGHEYDYDWRTGEWGAPSRTVY